MDIYLLRAVVVRALIVLALLSAMACQKESARSVSPKITSLTLINAESGEPVAGFDPMPDGAVINMAKLPTRKLNIRANVSPEDFDGFVDFQHVGRNAILRDNHSPYTLNGDEKSTITGAVRYYGIPLELGKRTLQVTPQQGDKAGTPLIINYEVIDQP
jgi:hypothetical protein